MNESELTLIIRETKPVVLSAIGKTLPERYAHAVDDVVQETYLRAFKALTKGSFRNEAKVTTWLYTIARNESLRMAEKLGREEKRRADFDVTVTDLSSREDGFDIDLDLLQGAIAELPQKYREVMELIAKGQSEKEVAMKLAIPAGTVKSRASRGRELIRATIEGENR